MNDMGDFAKGFKTMSVEELFYRGDGDGDKNNIEGKYDKDGNLIDGTKKNLPKKIRLTVEVIMAGVSPSPILILLAKVVLITIVWYQDLTENLSWRRWPLEVSSTVSITLILW